MAKEPGNADDWGGVGTSWVVSHTLCGQHAREESGGYRKRIWRGQHHVCAARRADDVCRPGGKQSEGLAATLQDFEAERRTVSPFSGLKFAPRTRYGLRRHYGHGIASQCSSRGDEA